MQTQLQAPEVAGLQHEQLQVTLCAAAVAALTIPLALAITLALAPTPTLAPTRA